jgi:hypothetical protein
MSRAAPPLARRIPRRKSSQPNVLGYEVVQKLLREFASVLLPRGMTPKQFGELARSAFAHAAADKSRLRNGRVNQSRVAAQTGLSRADVKRLLCSPIPGRAFDLSPIQKVLNGWIGDRQFTDRRGCAKKLVISGDRSAFKQLVEKYAGDIPYRAVLNELDNMGIVAVTPNHVEMCRSENLRGRNDFSFLTPLRAPFEDGLRIVSTPQKSRSAPLIQRLQLPVATEVDLAIVKDRCIERATAMLEGLSHSISERVTLPKRRSNAAYSFTVTVLLAERHAEKPHRRSRRDKKG